MEERILAPEEDKHNTEPTQWEEISPIEAEIGAYLILNPQRYRDFQEPLSRYQPVSRLLMELVEAFNKAIEKDGSPIFVDKHLPMEVHKQWLHIVETYRLHIFPPDIVIRLRNYLDREGRKQELIATVDALLKAIQSSGISETARAHLHKAHILLLERERSLNLHDVVAFVRSLRDERNRPACHPFPYLGNALNFEVDIYHNDITVIAGRTGRGKTTMALNIAKSYIDAGKTVCYITTEMDEHAIATKFAAIVTNTPWRHLWGRQFNLELAMKAAEKLEQYVISRRLAENPGGLLIYHAPACTVSDISYAATQCRAYYDRVDAIIVDYIQQVSLGINKRDETRAAELGAITREIADIVVEHGAAGIIVSQVNHAGEIKDSRAIMERAALVVRLGMWNYEIFERNIKRMLGYPKDAIFPPDVRSALREFFKIIIDVEVVKNRYGPFAAGQIGFIQWNPEVGVVERPLTPQEFMDRVISIVKEQEGERKQARRKKEDREKPPAQPSMGDFPELPSFTPEDFMDSAPEEDDDEYEFPF